VQKRYKINKAENAANKFGLDVVGLPRIIYLNAIKYVDLVATVFFSKKNKCGLKG
jgi:hypothetical protein